MLNIAQQIHEYFFVCNFDVDRFTSYSSNFNACFSFQNNYNIPKHQTQADRCAAAQLLLSHNPPCPVAVDSMLDAANLAYGASPERLYIIRDNRIVYQGGPGPFAYSLKEVRVWLENYSGRVLHCVPEE